MFGTAAIHPLEPAVYTLAAGSDPISAFLERDWAAFGGWSLFVMLCVLIVTSFMRGWIVPGSMYRSLEEASKLQAATLATVSGTLDKQVQANEISSYFFKETAPKRGETPNDE
jgi:hypothetical protein